MGFALLNQSDAASIVTGLPMDIGVFFCVANFEKVHSQFQNITNQSL
jgi:hypothetical protein